MRFILSVIFVFLFVIGCGDDDNGKSTDTASDAGYELDKDSATSSMIGKETNKTIGEKGGELELEEITIEIPEGALSDEVEFSIKVVEPPVPIPDDYVRVSDVYECTPHGLEFKKPVSLDIDYSDKTGETFHVLKLSDTADNSWDIEKAAEFESSVTTLEVDHFSFFTVVYKIEKAISKPDSAVIDAGVTDAGDDGDTDTDADMNTGETATVTGGPDTIDGLVIDKDWTTIPPGSFWMGTPDGDCPEDYPQPGTTCTEEPGRDERVEFLRYVKLTHGFQIMRKEATVRLYKNKTGWIPSVSHCRPCPVSYGEPGYFEFCVAECAVGVSFFDALAIANKMSLDEDLEPCYLLSEVRCSGGTEAGKEVGDAYMDCLNLEQDSIWNARYSLNGVSSAYECEGYRLPTGAEWEYAARAGSLTAFYPSDGNDGTITQTGYDPKDPNLTQIASYGEDSRIGITFEPAQKEANAWGLYDMLGNNFEWVWGLSDKSGDTTDPVVDPLGDTPNLRGGSWVSPAEDCRSGAASPDAEPRRNSLIYGVRFVRTVTE